MESCMTASVFALKSKLLVSFSNYRVLTRIISEWASFLETDIASTLQSFEFEVHQTHRIIDEITGVYVALGISFAWLRTEGTALGRPFPLARVSYFM